jgi:hypothetical protein
MYFDVSQDRIFNAGLISHHKEASPCNFFSNGQGLVLATCKHDPFPSRSPRSVSNVREVIGPFVPVGPG